jgi:hypothetical protein
MNYNEIDRLLERYLDGETSLSEEKILRDFLSGSGIPEKYKPYSDLFQGFAEAEKLTFTSRNFDKSIKRRLKQADSKSLRPVVSISWYLVSGIAATVILAVLLFVPIQRLPVFNLFSDKIGDTFEDPQKAYAETVKVLLLVSEKLNSGTNKMKSMGKFNKGLEDAGKMTNFNRGAREIGELNKINVLRINENKTKSNNL